MLVSGSPAAALASGSDIDPDARPACRSPSDWGCSVGDVRAASKATLRKAGSTITVSCGARLEDSPVDAAYMQSCIENMRGLADFLSKKWSSILQPVDANLIQYDWNKSFGCITVLLDSGGMTGSCPVYGEARIPLTWRDAEPAASGVE
ncbi:MAG: hypothetical protein KF800_18505 [Lysobacter sp.]|nr:hypothetical protein [Lysobacter sp.]